jgi:hypothetical protein
MHDLSQFCKTLKETFTMDYNRRTGNVGGIWGGRFRSVLVAPEAAALLSVGAYVDANPVKAGMAHRPRDYRWAGFGMTFDHHITEPTNKETAIKYFSQ